MCVRACVECLCCRRSACCVGVRSYRTLAVLSFARRVRAFLVWFARASDALLCPLPTIYPGESALWEWMSCASAARVRAARFWL